MEKVITKVFIGNKEVSLVAEHFGIKFYNNDNIIYITYYDEVIAEVKADAIKFDDKLTINTQ